MLLKELRNCLIKICPRSLLKHGCDLPDISKVICLIEKDQKHCKILFPSFVTPHHLHLSFQKKMPAKIIINKDLSTYVQKLRACLLRLNGSFTYKLILNTKKMPGSNPFQVP
jgi:hypothetical protein